MADIILTEDIRRRFSTWPTDDFITEILKLRQENGNRRVKLKEYEITQGKLQEDFTTNTTINKAKVGALSAALNNLQTKNKELEKQISSDTVISKDAAMDLRKETEQANDILKEENTALQQTLQREKILRTAYTELYTNGYKFRNALEKVGFESSILANVDGVYKNVETIQEEIQELIETNQQNVTVPLGGPAPLPNLKQNKTKRMQELLKKPKLSSEEVTELKDLAKE